MMAEVTNYSRGLGLWNGLGLIFVTLKLLGEWIPNPIARLSWWYVTLPFWGPFILIFVVFAIAGVVIAFRKSALS